MRKLVLLVGAVALLAAACGDDDERAEDPTTTTTEAETTTTTEATPESSTTTRPASDAADTARRWIDAIGRGEDDVAIALTSARSLEAFGGREGWEANRTALAEGWGAWSHAEDLEVSTLAPISDGVVVVVLHGQVPQEGPPAETWAALPVVRTEDGDRVEPFLDLGEITVDPPPFTEIPDRPHFTVTTPADVQVQAVVDFGHSSRVAQVVGEDATTVEVSPNEPLAPGLHVLTVVLHAGDDVMARTFEYPVEG